MYPFTQFHHKESRFRQLPSIEMTTVRMDTLIAKGVVDISQYDVLVTDVQGADYDVVASFGEHVKQFRLLKCEVMTRPIYKNIKLEKQLTEYLSTQGFKLISNFGYNRGVSRDNIYLNTQLAWRRYYFCELSPNVVPFQS